MFNLNRFQTLIDSSHIITFCISISVIIYGSFKSLNIDTDNELLHNAEQDLANKGEHSKTQQHEQHQSTQTIDSTHAVIIPIAASVSLLLMFFFFESIQTAFLLCTSGRNTRNIVATLIQS